MMGEAAAAAGGSAENAQEPAAKKQKVEEGKEVTVHLKAKAGPRRSFSGRIDMNSVVNFKPGPHACSLRAGVVHISPSGEAWSVDTESGPASPSAAAAAAAAAAASPLSSSTAEAAQPAASAPAAVIEPAPRALSKKSGKKEVSYEGVLAKLSALPRDADAHTLGKGLLRDELRLLLKANGVSYHRPGEANAWKTKGEMSSDLLALIAQGLKTVEEVPEKLRSTSGGPPREGGERPGPAAPPSPVPEPEPTDHLPEELKVILFFSPLADDCLTGLRFDTRMALLCCSRS